MSLRLLRTNPRPRRNSGFDLLRAPLMDSDSWRFSAEASERYSRPPSGVMGAISQLSPHGLNSVVALAGQRLPVVTEESHILYSAKDEEDLDLKVQLTAGPLDPPVQKAVLIREAERIDSAVSASVKRIAGRLHEWLHERGLAVRLSTEIRSHYVHYDSYYTQPPQRAYTVVDFSARIQPYDLDSFEGLSADDRNMAAEVAGDIAEAFLQEMLKPGN